MKGKLQLRLQKAAVPKDKQQHRRVNVYNWNGQQTGIRKVWQNYDSLIRAYNRKEQSYFRISKPKQKRNTFVTNNFHSSLSFVYWCHRRKKEYNILVNQRLHKLSWDSYMCNHKLEVSCNEKYMKQQTMRVAKLFLFFFFLSFEERQFTTFILTPSYLLVSEVRLQGPRLS